MQQMHMCPEAVIIGLWLIVRKFYLPFSPFHSKINSQQQLLWDSDIPDFKHKQVSVNTQQKTLMLSWLTHPFISVRRNNVAFFDVYHLKMKEWIYLDKKDTMKVKRINLNNQIPYITEKKLRGLVPLWRTTCLQK